MKFKKKAEDEIVKEIDSYIEEEILEKEKKDIESLKKWLKKNWIMIGTVIAIANSVLLATRYLLAIATINNRIVSNNPLYIITASVGPIIMWVLSTDTEYWNFHNRKIFLIRLCIINAVAVFLQPVYSLTWRVVVPNVFKIPITAAMTEGMIILLAQILLVAELAIAITVIIILIYPLLLSKEATIKIKKFKLKHHIDTRKYKENLYDMEVVKDLETGKTITVKEKDRFVHSLINGASGTGKTSSVYLPAIAQDMAQKEKNKIARTKVLISMLIKGEAYVKGPVREFNEYTVAPKEKYKKKYNELYKKYPDCGTTVIAPNNSIIDDIIKLAKAQNLNVNVLDPAASYDKYENVIVKGINPFFIPFGLDEAERAVRISNAASVFSDVIIAVNEANGKSDVYFSDISKSVTTNIAIVCMLAANIRGKQTNIKEIQNSVSNFELIKKNVKEIEDHFHINVIAPKLDTSGGSSNEQITTDNIKKQSGARKETSEKDTENPYYQTILFIKSELLGEGAVKMFDQARGLRNLINKLLGDPRIKEILSADDAHRIDFDQMLAENSITVVNTALEFGSEISRAFGLFFILTQKVSVLRRPKDKRSTHLIWIDEVSQYMHQSLEEMFTLYRQYGVACYIAIQSLSQMEKSDLTRYLKGVFMGAGTHIVFGRLSPDEMELYSTMAGASEVDVVQKTVSQSSILSDNPSITTSERSNPTMKNKMEGSDIRILDFQEVTVLTIDNGRVLEGKFGKVSFLQDSDFRQRPKYNINWDKLKDKIEIVEKEVDDQNEQNRKDSSKESKKIKIPEAALPEKVEEKIVLNVSTKVEEVLNKPVEELKKRTNNVELSDLLENKPDKANKETEHTNKETSNEAKPAREEVPENPEKPKISLAALVRGTATLPEDGVYKRTEDENRSGLPRENSEKPKISLAALVRGTATLSEDGVYHTGEEKEIDYAAELRKMNGQE